MMMGRFRGAAGLATLLPRMIISAAMFAVEMDMAHKIIARIEKHDFVGHLQNLHMFEQVQDMRHARRHAHGLQLHMGNVR